MKSFLPSGLHHSTREMNGFRIAGIVASPSVRYTSAS